MASYLLNMESWLEEGVSVSNYSEKLSFETLLTLKAKMADVVRQLADFPPSLWADHFASFTSDSTTAFEEYNESIGGLKEYIRELLVEKMTTAIEKMSLIDSIHRLGLSYHFAEEINGQLEKLFGEIKSCGDCEHYDLYTISLHFRVFRQHGYKMSSDVFNKFKNSEGNFQDSLASDAKGILSFYEATHLRIRGEDILDEALAFTTVTLESMVATADPPMVKQISKAFELPFHKGMPRIEARSYISTYEDDKSHDKSLLKLARIDFNFLQKMHREELNLVSKWWKNLGFAEKVSYARHRIAECYFWILGIYFEPCYSIGRIILTKIILLLVLLDDTYDAFGTLAELTLFTDAVNNWDTSAIDQLPDSMQFFCRALLNSYDEIEEQMAKEGRAYSVHQAKEEMKVVARAYYHEAEWFNSGYQPTFDEYMETAIVSTAQPMLLASAFVGMGELATKEAFDWLQTRPKSMLALQTHSRLLDDIKTHKFEQKRGHVPSAVECYMCQYGVTEKEAIDELKERIEDAWKDLNEECLTPNEVSMDLLKLVLNLTRVVEVVYKYGDGFTNTELLKDYIKMLLVDPLVF